ncbi:protein TolQ [Ferrimonas pelagia]|uniref:Tol-Pal system protein TolQ n=1 Tax=Ferrimonas pelagia TaxID=1177826 RepID=A0ABP9EBE2_9GAMM
MSAEISFIGLFLEASLLVKLVMIFLMVLSVAAWTVIFQRQSALKQAHLKAQRFEDRFWSGVDLNRLYQELSARGDRNTGLELMFTNGFREYIRLAKSSRSPEAVMDGSYRAMRVAMSREVDKLEQHLPMLASIGSTSPYIGLFGTVWGIMNSFIALGSVQHATLNMVAPGIAEALIATAMGLFAAIPAVIFFNRFSTRVEKLENSYANFMDEFSTILHRQAHSTNGQAQNGQPERGA